MKEKQSLINRDIKEIEDERLIRDALELRLAGASFTNIAKQLDISVHRATTLINQALAYEREETLDIIEHLKNINVERLNKLILTLWHEAIETKDVNLIREIRNLIVTQNALLGVHNNEAQHNTYQDIKVIIPQNTNPQDWVSQTQEMMQQREDKVRIIEQALE